MQQNERMEVDDEEKDQDRTIRGLEDLPRQSIDSRIEDDDDEDIAMGDYDSNKDLFLSLAKAEPPKVGINARRTQDRQQVIPFIPQYFPSNCTNKSVTNCSAFFDAPSTATCFT